MLLKNISSLWVNASNIQFVGSFCVDSYTSTLNYYNFNYKTDSNGDKWFEQPLADFYETSTSPPSFYEARIIYNFSRPFYDYCKYGDYDSPNFSLLIFLVVVLPTLAGLCCCCCFCIICCNLGGIMIYDISHPGKYDTYHISDEINKFQSLTLANRREVIATP